MRTPILFIVITEGEKKRNSEIQSSLPMTYYRLSIWETSIYANSLYYQYILPLFPLLRHGHNSIPLPLPISPLQPSLPHLPLHRDCHCYWYATQPSHLISQATATPMKAYADRNPNHPRLRHTDPFYPSERRVCLAFLSVRKQGGAWAQGKCVTLTECTLRSTHISIHLFYTYTLVSSSRMYAINVI